MAAARPLTMLHEFLRQEAAGGVLLVLATAFALVLANSPAAPAYTAALHLPVVVRTGGIGLDEPLLHWINDGLMAVFFLLVGLEIKREPLHAAEVRLGVLSGSILSALLGYALLRTAPARQAATPRPAHSLAE